MTEERVTAAEARQYGAFDFSNLQRALAEIDGIPLGDADDQLRDAGETIREALNHFGIPELAPIELLREGDFVRITGGETGRAVGSIGKIVEDDRSHLPYRVGFNSDPEGYTDYDWFRRDHVEKVNGEVELVTVYRIVED